MLCHGLGDDDMWRPPPAGKAVEITDRQRELLKDVSIVLHGHTHRRGVVEIPALRTVLLNVGSLLDPEPTVTLVDLASGLAEHLTISQPGGLVRERILLRTN